MVETNKRVILLLRIGVAFAFLYPPIDALFNPNAWIGYFPSFVFEFFPDPTFILYLFGIVEVAIALWILSGKKIFIPSSIAVVMLVTIVLFNLSQMEVLFRDLSIAAMSLALALCSYPKRSA